MKKLSNEQRAKIVKVAKITGVVSTTISTIGSVFFLGKAIKDGDAKKIAGFGALSTTSAVTLNTLAGTLDK